MFQYFVKIVPTTYAKLGGQVSILYGGGLYMYTPFLHPTSQLYVEEVLLLVYHTTPHITISVICHVLTLTLKRVYFDNNEYCNLRKKIFFLKYICYNVQEQAWCQ